MRLCCRRAPVWRLLFVCGRGWGVDDRRQSICWWGLRSLILHLFWTRWQQLFIFFLNQDQGCLQSRAEHLKSFVGYPYILLLLFFYKNKGTFKAKHGFLIYLQFLLIVLNESIAQLIMNPIFIAKLWWTNLFFFVLKASWLLHNITWNVCLFHCCYHKNKQTMWC